MKKDIKDIKGIPLSDLDLEDSIITTEDSVLKFFGRHPQEAFSINMLTEAGFSSNIRKVIIKLIEQEKIIQTSKVEEGKSKWEYLYYLKPPKSLFDLKKTDDGWKLTKITLNGKWFNVNCEIVDAGTNNLFEISGIHISLGFPKEGDAILYSTTRDENTNSEWLSSARVSEIKSVYENLANLIHIFQKCENIWDFEVDTPDKRKRVSKSTSQIEGEKILLWAGQVGFLFVIDSKELTVSIYPRYRELDADGNVFGDEDIDYFDENYGSTYIDDEEDEDETEDEYDEDDEEDEDDADNERRNEETFDFVGIGDVDESLNVDIIKQDVNFIVLRGRR